MKVCIREVLERVVDVNSIEEAEQLYRAEKVVLDAGDLVSLDFEKTE